MASSTVKVPLPPSASVVLDVTPSGWREFGEAEISRAVGFCMNRIQRVVEVWATHQTLRIAVAILERDEPLEFNRIKADLEALSAIPLAPCPCGCGVDLAVRECQRDELPPADLTGTETQQIAALVRNNPPAGDVEEVLHGIVGSIMSRAKVPRERALFIVERAYSTALRLALVETRELATRLDGGYMRQLDQLAKNPPRGRETPSAADMVAKFWPEHYGHDVTCHPDPMRDEYAIRCVTCGQVKTVSGLAVAAQGLRQRDQAHGWTFGDKKIAWTPGEPTPTSQEEMAKLRKLLDDANFVGVAGALDAVKPITSGAMTFDSLKPYAYDIQHGPVGGKPDKG